MRIRPEKNWCTFCLHEKGDDNNITGLSLMEPGIHVQHDKKFDLVLNLAAISGSPSLSTDSLPHRRNKIRSHAFIAKIKNFTVAWLEGEIHCLGETNLVLMVSPFVGSWLVEETRIGAWMSGKPST